MKKILNTFIFLLLSTILKAQVPDIAATKPVPGTGAAKNNQTIHYANAAFDLNLRVPHAASWTLNGAKDSIGYIMYNVVAGRFGVYTGSGSWQTFVSPGDLISTFNNNAGYITGNYTGFDGRYLRYFTETDPTVSAFVKSITPAFFTPGNTAFSWGNHAGLYPLINGLYDNPSFVNSLPASKITGLGTASRNNTGDFFPRPVILFGNTDISTAFATGVYRNENGLGGAYQYSPTLVLNAGNTGLQINGQYDGNNLQFRGFFYDGINPAIFTPWKLLWNSGNFNPTNYALISSLGSNAFNSVSYYPFSNPNNFINSAGAPVQPTGTYPNLTTGNATHAGSADNATTAVSAGAATNAEYVANDAAYMRFHWQGQAGQPSWLWGGNDPNNMYVYNPTNLAVSHAVNSDNAVNAGTAANATHANNADNATNAVNSNYANSSGSITNQGALATKNSVSLQDAANAGTAISQAITTGGLTTGVINSAEIYSNSNPSPTNQATLGQTMDTGEMGFTQSSSHPYTINGGQDTRKISSVLLPDNSFVWRMFGPNVGLAANDRMVFTHNYATGITTIPGLKVPQPVHLEANFAGNTNVIAFAHGLTGITNNSIVTINPKNPAAGTAWYYYQYTICDANYIYLVFSNYPPANIYEFDSYITP